MDKEEILEQARKENKNKDPHEKDVNKTSAVISAIAMGVLCVVFTVFEICIGAKSFYAFEALIFTLCAAQFIYKSIKFKRRQDIVLSVAYSILAVSFTAEYLYVMITTYCLA